MGCNICPRKCNANRKTNIGYCGCSDKITVNRFAPHYWEEPCISGSKGAGNIFFGGCQLHCLYCQNRVISETAKGRSVSSDELCDIFFQLKELNVHNINLVTPDMYIPQIIPSIIKAKENNIDLPFIMNCSGYETVDMIRALDGLIDIYLPDFKYMSSLLAKKYSNAADYPEVAKNALKEMVRQKSCCVFNSEGIMTSGVIVRHMLLPGNTYDSKKIIKYLHDTYGDSIYISIMSQYTPINNSPYNELNRKVTQEEYDELVDFSIECGLTNAFIQDGEAANEEFIPDFFT